MSASNRYANEEVASSHRYPEEYRGPKPINERIKAIAKIFSLNPKQALEFVKSLPALPIGAEGWFPFPSIEALARRFFPGVRDKKEWLCAASNLILANIGKSRKFYNFREGKFTPDRFHMNAKTACALEILSSQQSGDILIAGAQFGRRYAGKSVRRAQELINGHEFGAHTVAAGSMLLTDPERLVSFHNLWFSVPGDEFDLRTNGSFDHVPYFHFSFGGRVKFDTLWVGNPYEFCGSVSLFLPA